MSSQLIVWTKKKTQKQIGILNLYNLKSISTRVYFEIAGYQNWWYNDSVTNQS